MSVRYTVSSTICVFCIVHYELCVCWETQCQVRYDDITCVTWSTFSYAHTCYKHTPYNTYICKSSVKQCMSSIPTNDNENRPREKHYPTLLLIIIVLLMIRARHTPSPKRLSLHSFHAITNTNKGVSEFKIISQFEIDLELLKDYSSWYSPEIWNKDYWNISRFLQFLQNRPERAAKAFLTQLSWETYSLLHPSDNTLTEEDYCWFILWCFPPRI